MNEKIISSALHTIDLEAESVAGIERFIDDGFVKVVQSIHQSKGRVVVSGIGKSAIVGQKIVATLNSTGTPALFSSCSRYHTWRSRYGAEDDIVIIISKSGESPEIKVLAPLIKTLAIPW